MCVGPELFAALGAGTGAAGTLANVANVALVAAQGAGAVSQIRQAQHAEAMGEFNAQIARNEAIAAQQATQHQLEQHQRQVARFKGQQRARAAASGGELLDMGDVFAETAEQAELDALAIRYGGRMAQQAAMQRGQFAMLQGQQARSQGFSKAGASLLGGAVRGSEFASERGKVIF